MIEAKITVTISMSEMETLEVYTIDTQEEDFATVKREGMVTKVSMTEKIIQDETLHLLNMQCFMTL